jgi:hypothetical protein
MHGGIAMTEQSDEPKQAPQHNSERRSTSIYKILAGAGGGGFLTFLTWMITQATTPIIRDQQRIEQTMMANKIELLAAIEKVRLDQQTGLASLMTLLRDEKTSQWRIDEKQNLEIGELKLLNRKYKEN